VGAAPKVLVAQGGEFCYVNVNVGGIGYFDG
jgi:hypothetical protein